MKYPTAECMKYIFNPRSIAVAGVSGDPNDPLRELFLKPFIDFGFKGKIYPLNPKGGEIMGMKIYPSISDVPEPVDYVFAATPAPTTPQLIKDCVAKGVKVITLFTAGFSESGEQKGIELETEITRIARQGGVRLLGPNCLGIYCPSSRLSYNASFPRESGNVAFISQSGGNALYGVRAAASRGVRFSKAISYGNACDINETDLLDYLIHDPDTEIIAAYIEGVKDGTRFSQVLKKAARAKPVIILKGGCTDSGTRTAASHTGSMAGSNRVWDGLFKQAGAIQVQSVEELVDMILLFLYMPLPKGRNAGVVGVGGGANVQAADDCERAGLSLPPIPPKTRKMLGSLFATEAGTILRNPLDTMSPLLTPEQFSDTIRIVASWKGIDFLLLHIALDVGFPPFEDRNKLEFLVGAMLDSAKRCNKPTAIVLHSASSAQSWHTLFKEQQRCYEAGFPVYPSIKHAASAISKFLKYHKVHEWS